MNETVKSRVIPCPTCRRSTRYDPSNPYRPFCSARCKNEDVISWAEESYRVPGPPADPEELLSALKERRDEEAED